MCFYSFPGPSRDRSAEPLVLDARAFLVDVHAGLDGKIEAPRRVERVEGGHAVAAGGLELESGAVEIGGRLADEEL